jgi:TonB family protein
MHNLRLLCTLLLCLLLFHAMLRAQATPTAPPATSAIPAAAANPKTPIELLARACQLSDLIAAGIPFQLKASYVATGDAEFTGIGTYEEWWQSKESWRKEATLGDYKYVTFTKDGKMEIYSTSSYIPLRLRQTLLSLPSSFTELAVISGNWEQRHQKLTGINFLVLSKKHRCAGQDSSSGKNEQCEQAYYLTAEGLLRIHAVDATMIVYNGFQAFQSLLIPFKVDLSDGSGELLALTVSMLEPLDADAKTVSNLAVTPVDLQQGPDLRLASSKLMQSRAVRQAPPVYPMEAKQRRIQGTVAVDATIDVNGTIREPHVVETAGPILDHAALQCVRQWKYQPLMVNGAPVPVDTTIRVEFRMR